VLALLCDPALGSQRLALEQHSDEVCPDAFWQFATNSSTLILTAEL
jgi:hypothetical protein